MNYSLPANSLYGNTPAKFIARDEWEVEVSGFKGEYQPKISMENLKEAIINPIGKKGIASDAKGAKNAVIIFDDITRPTPIEDIAKIIISELEEAGVERKNIWFMCAIGTHRAMYREDFVRKLGEDIVSEFQVYCHNPFFNNTFLGITSNNTPIEVNSDVVMADYKIAIGAIFPHPMFGFGGGGKIVLPGICSFETIRKNHTLVFMKATPNDYGAFVTPGRSDAEEAADMLGLDFKVDVLMNGNGEIVKAYSGDYKKVMEAAVPEATEFFKTKLIQNADIVVANTYFKPTEPGIGLLSGTMKSLKPGGDFIISTHSPQGCAPHYMLGIWGFHNTVAPLSSGPKHKPDVMGRFIYYSQYLDKATAQTYQMRIEDTHYAKTPEALLELLGTGYKKVAIYKYAVANILE